MRVDDLITRADQLIAQAAEVVLTRSEHRENAYLYEEHVSWAAYTAFRASALSFVRGVFGPTHTYVTELDLRLDSSHRDTVQAGRSILQAVRAELAGGWFITVRQLLSAEIFSDFLEMADYLYDEGYHHPAAVLVGSVLEEHLRQLATRHSVDVTVTDPKGKIIPKKSDALNSDLAKASVYNKLDQKNVTAWLDLRNKAAHGKYTEYSKEQVGNMLTAVAEFIARVTI